MEPHRIQIVHYNFSENAINTLMLETRLSAIAG